MISKRIGCFPEVAPLRVFPFVSDDSSLEADRLDRITRDRFRSIDPHVIRYARPCYTRYDVDLMFERRIVS